MMNQTAIEISMISNKRKIQEIRLLANDEEVLDTLYGKK